MTEDHARHIMLRSAQDVLFMRRSLPQHIANVYTSLYFSEWSLEDKLYYAKMLIEQALDKDGPVYSLPKFLIKHKFPELQSFWNNISTDTESLDYAWRQFQQKVQDEDANTEEAS